jgi:pimeloyl-ACP methyl ester carboxylesterase
MKQSLVLLHGALGSAQQFDPLVPLLTGHFQVHRFNFAGHGGVHAGQDLSMSLFVSDLSTFLSKNKLHKPHVFGYSMGGYVALNLAAREPENLGTICTLGTKFLWTPEEAEKEKGKLQPDIIEQKVPAFARMLEQRHAPLDWKQLLYQTAGMMQQLGNGGALGPAELSTISNKVTIGWGNQDKMVGKEESESTAKLLKYGQFRELEGLPHPIEQIPAEILAQYILETLNS